MTVEEHINPCHPSHLQYNIGAPILQALQTEVNPSQQTGIVQHQQSKGLSSVESKSQHPQLLQVPPMPGHVLGSNQHVQIQQCVSTQYKVLTPDQPVQPKQETLNQLALNGFNELQHSQHGFVKNGVVEMDQHRRFQQVVSLPNQSRHVKLTQDNIVGTHQSFVQNNDFSINHPQHESSVQNDRVDTDQSQ